MAGQTHPGRDWGYCDVCGVRYNLASFEDHCTECGNCNAHCSCSPAKRAAVKAEHQRLIEGRR